MTYCINVINIYNARTKMCMCIKYVQERGNISAECKKMVLIVYCNMYSKTVYRHSASTLVSEASVLGGTGGTVLPGLYWAMKGVPRRGGGRRPETSLTLYPPTGCPEQPELQHARPSSASVPHPPPERMPRTSHTLCPESRG